MRNRSPLAMLGSALVLVIVLVAAGTALGIGPLAGAPAAAKVTDPREMMARSLQSVLDAQAVHLDGTLTGAIPGSLVHHPEDVVSLDGSSLTGDLRPKDAKTSTHLVSPGLGLEVAAISVWDGVWYRATADDPWQRASLGGASSQAGVDINPLTLVDRLRGYLATPGVSPVVEEVSCAAASGHCHRITLEAGRDPATILRAMLPADQVGSLPDVRTTVVLDTDAESLRPARLVVDSKSEDGGVLIHLDLATSRWDDPGIVIDEPKAAS